VATPKKKQVQTSDQHGTTQVKGTLAQDYVTVVGASYMSMIEKLRSQRGNKMRFINQGIRQLTKYPEGTPNFSRQRVFLIFKDDYEEKLLTAVKTWLKVSTARNIGSWIRFQVSWILSRPASAVAER